MPVYIISLSSPTKGTAWREEYYRLVTPLLAKHRGTIVRTGSVVNLERGTDWQRGAVIEFPQRADALGFYSDPAYRPAKDLRLAHTDGEAYLIGD
ncbi:MAG: DUF1330 domain-containing protein [Alphaproteobacteria bacterium]|nr:DUF1330 domain-containing protein [Alphaproteobacteria bacterium]